MDMNMLFRKQIIFLFMWVFLPIPSVMAGSFSEMLRDMGISIAPSGVKSPGSIFRGNLWLSKIDETRAHEPKPITGEGTYHSPLWIPGSNKILAIKENKLVQLEIDGRREKILYGLSDSTTLHGFDTRDANSVLILQDSMPALLSLANGKITRLSYDEKNPEDRTALDRLRRDYRKYGHTEVIITKNMIVDARGNEEEINKIHIKADKKDIIIPCPENCIQPALSEDGRQLVFVGP